jgi:hypothetical protein
MNSVYWNTEYGELWVGNGGMGAQLMMMTRHSLLGENNL